MAVERACRPAARERLRKPLSVAGVVVSARRKGVCLRRPREKCERKAGQADVFRLHSKYPVTSITRSSAPAALFFTVARPVPSAARRTQTLFATVRPALKLIEEAFGMPVPAGYRTRSPAACGATTVTLTATDFAVAGMPHAPASANVRVPLAAIAGPPSGATGLRVSTRRHGVTGCSVDAAGGAAGCQPRWMTSKSLAWIPEKAGFRTPLSQRVS